MWMTTYTPPRSSFQQADAGHGYARPCWRKRQSAVTAIIASTARCHVVATHFHQFLPSATSLQLLATVSIFSRGTLWAMVMQQRPQKFAAPAAHGWTRLVLFVFTELRQDGASAVRTVKDGRVSTLFVDTGIINDVKGDSLGRLFILEAEKYRVPHADLDEVRVRRGDAVPGGAGGRPTLAYVDGRAPRGRPPDVSVLRSLVVRRRPTML